MKISETSAWNNTSGTHNNAISITHQGLMQQNIYKTYILFLFYDYSCKIDYEWSFMKVNKLEITTFMHAYDNSLSYGKYSPKLTESSFVELLKVRYYDIRKLNIYCMSL